MEVAHAVAEAIGPERVGIRISPAHNIQGATEEDPADVEATYGALIDGIAPLGLAYLSVLADPSLDLVQRLRKDFGGVLIANTGFADVTTREQAQALLDDDLADAVAVGRLFLANPDLPRRWQTGADAERAEPGHVLRRRRRGLHRLPVAGGLTRDCTATRARTDHPSGPVARQPGLSRGPCTGSGSPSAGRTSP